MGRKHTFRPAKTSSELQPIKSASFSPMRRSGYGYLLLGWLWGTCVIDYRLLCMALCEGFNEGKTLLERYYLLATSHGKPEVSCYCDGAHAQICMTLCEAFNEGEVCCRRLYLPAASHGKPSLLRRWHPCAQVCMALCEAFNEGGGRGSAGRGITCCRQP